MINIIYGNSYTEIQDCIGQYYQSIQPYYYPINKLLFLSFSYFEKAGGTIMELFKEIKNIERLRSEMVKLGKEKGLLSSETINVSQQLDREMNEWNNVKDKTINLNEINSVIHREALILITDTNGVIVYLNDKCSAALGYQPIELIGKHTRIFKTGIHSSEFYHDLWETLLSGHNWRGEITAKRKDGSTVWNFLTIFPLYDESSRIYQFLTLRTDITDLKEMEQQALLKDKQIYSFFEVLPDAVAGCINEYGTILYSSPSVEKVLGYKVSERLGLSIFDFISPDTLPDFRKSLEELKKEPGKIISIKVMFKTKSGTNLSCELTAKNYLQDPILKAIVFTYRDMTEQGRFNQLLENMMNNDALTGLPTTVSFEEQVNNGIEHANDNNTILAVILFGLDDFKLINTTFGHHVGDLLLKEFTERCKSMLSEKILMYRMSGDIFIFLMKDIKDIAEIRQIPTDILSLIRKDSFLIEENEIFVSGSMGVSIFPYSGEDSEALLKNAEIAMYRAKNSGKNQYQIFSPTMNLYSYKQYMLRNDSKKALFNNEFRVYYQPRINPLTNEMVSAESLIRWKHPKWGLVMPDEFISMAEESGLIIPIGEWMIRKVCNQIKKWGQENLWMKKVSINLSALQLLQPNFVERVSSIIKELSVNPRWIEFEITETVIIEKEEQVLKTLNKLADLGMTIALDDFGTGYSSLSYLKKFPCKTIKIDKSLIGDIYRDKENHEIISSIITLCHKLNKTVVAEGVENEQQLLILRKLHCDEIQGYLYSKPVDGFEYESFLKDGNRFKDERAEINPNINRRKYFRVSLDVPLVADMTIEQIAGTKVNIGNSEVMVKNISAGGLCFYSNLKLPVSKKIILLFNTEITHIVLNIKGKIVWKEEMESNYYEYGVEFLLNMTEEENLIKILNNFQIKLQDTSNLPGCRFYKF